MTKRRAHTDEFEPTKILPALPHLNFITKNTLRGSFDILENNNNNMVCSCTTADAQYCRQREVLGWTHLESAIPRACRRRLPRRPELYIGALNLRKTSTLSPLPVAAVAQYTMETVG
jgi:hypothetical protein